MAEFVPTSEPAYASPIPPGATVYYLVRAGNACPVGEGTLGFGPGGIVGDTFHQLVLVGNLAAVAGTVRRINDS